jgi:hypothetical protein
MSYPKSIFERLIRECMLRLFVTDVDVSELLYIERVVKNPNQLCYNESIESP